MASEERHPVRLWQLLWALRGANQLKKNHLINTQPTAAPHSHRNNILSLNQRGRGFSWNSNDCSNPVPKFSSPWSPFFSCLSKFLLDFFFRNESISDSAGEHPAQKKERIWPSKVEGTNCLFAQSGVLLLPSLHLPSLSRFFDKFPVIFDWWELGKNDGTLWVLTYIWKKSFLLRGLGEKVQIITFWDEFFGVSWWVFRFPQGFFNFRIFPRYIRSVSKANSKLSCSHFVLPFSARGHINYWLWA